MGSRRGASNQRPSRKKAAGIQKIATQIEGLDEILHGGLPAGRVTLVSGGPGTGKSLLGLEFLYRSALSGDPGIFLSFEETADGIRQNTLSLGWDLASLEKAANLFLMEGQVDPEAVISGGFNLKGLLAVIEGKAKEMGARRIVIDALDVLMRVFDDPGREQQQIFALHKWLTRQGLTAVLTTKNTKANELSSPRDYLDFMADCVIYLDQRIGNQVSTKRLQVIKYRGSGYGSNEYPFLIADHGMFLNPVSDIGLRYEASSQRVSTGNPTLDEISGGGYQRGACILVAGSAGTGKTSMASTFALSACEKGQKVLYVNFEESQDRMVAGMLSLGIDLRPAIQDASLRVMAVMPEAMGIEEHLHHHITAIKSFQPQHLVVDAISACKRIAGDTASFDLLVRLVHFCRQRGITALFLNQARNRPQDHDFSGIGISSLIDTIITLHFEDTGNQTDRILEVIKSRGSKHSNRHYQYVLTDKGIQINGVHGG
jgi:circadian clock protein KaiC